MSNFRIGQKVVCVIEDNTDIDNLGVSNTGPKLNEIVTIRWIVKSIGGRPCLEFHEYGLNECWDEYQFRPLVEPGFADELLAKISEEVESEMYANV